MDHGWGLCSSGSKGSTCMAMEIRMKTSEIEAKGLLACEFAFISYNILPYKFYPSEFDQQILLIPTGVTGRA